MNTTLKQLLAPLASLRLTVFLLSLSMLLIYAGTIAQTDAGIWQVQDKYFHSLFVRIPFNDLLPWEQVGRGKVPGGFPMLGGYSLGGLLLVNLLAAHAVRFKFNAKRIGVILIHAGLILLLVGELITSVFSVESQMHIDEGSYANYTQDIRSVELAIVDTSPADHNEEVVIPLRRISREGLIQDALLPFDVRVDDFYPNSNLLGPNQAGKLASARATAGMGVGITVLEQSVYSGTDMNAVDAPSAYVSFNKGGQALGTYLVSLWFERPQTINVDGKTYEIELRFKRDYKPYTIHLIDFAHDKYTGTETPKNFSSQIRLVDPTHNEDREILIRMNEPLRYSGETFYQASFKPGDKTTILQVVRNPAWIMPYVACVIGALGLVIHFGMTLIGFIRKQTAESARSRAMTPNSLEVNGVRPAALPGLAGFLIPAGVACFCLLYLISHARPPKEKSSYDWRGFAQLPVSYEGRTQPVDSLARNALKILSGKETLKLGDGTKVPPIQWLADTIARSDKSADYPVFRIDSPDIKSLLGFDVKDKHFSLNQILKNGDKLDEQFARANQARQADPRNLTDYQRKVLQLGQQLNLYSQFARDVGNVYFLPPLNSGDEWKPLAAGIAAHEGAVTSPAADHLIAAITGYHEDSPEQFNGHVRAYQTLLHEKLPATMDKVSFETFYNYYDPFMQCMVLYVGVFVLACISWLGFTGVFSRTALWVLAIALLLHTLGLIGRVYISGRPPVTNLASSAIFIAWGIVVFGYALELIFRNGIGSAAAAAAGFCSLLIADKLALQGDTMKVLQAVLDTNFWLATHVVVITLGYSATFFAGVIAIVYILVGIFTRASSARLKILTRMIYGVTCFAILFSFVGTILGGIWADQSWGRFWGWDPKENGAILIVLANALLLHARWGGLAGPRGIAMLAVFGNIVTSWSWFGTNMLGVGLHSYGFMDAAFQWLMLFILSQLFLIGISCIPQRLWRSSRTTQSISQKELAENNPSPIPSAVQ